jgi:hypothetical protein
MGWSESYFRDYEEQTRRELREAAFRLARELKRFQGELEKGEGLSWIDLEFYRNYVNSLVERLEKDFHLNMRPSSD